MIVEYFLLALNSIRRRRLRSWLTMIGIFIGIAAVVSLISLGQGLQNAINEQFEQLGSDTLTIMGKVGPITGPAASAMSSKPLTTKDIKLIEKVSGVDVVSSMLLTSAQVSFKDKNKNVIITGMPIDETRKVFETMTSWDIEEGNDLSDKNKYGVVLGNAFKEDVFDKRIRPRDKLDINGKKFKVVGILKKVSPTDDNALYVNLDSLRDISNKPDLVSMIFIKVKENQDPEIVAKKVEEKLRDYRNEKEGEESFSVSTSEQLLESLSTILNVIQAVLVGIAAISLLVGGIGIMNTMYTSVLERTKEIGVMKAIGARNSDVLLIFLVESGLLGLIGGAIGIAIGIGLSKGVERIAQQFLGSNLLQASLSPYLIIGALLFSSIIGSVSGMLPARQASKLKPVDALRYE